MDDNSAHKSETEKALDERVRQAEVLISAQVTFLAETYHRTAVLAGLVFVIVVALLSLTYTDLIDPPIIDFIRRVSMITLAPLALLVCATAITNADLPGAIDIVHTTVSASDLKMALLDQYRTSAKWNDGRLAVSRYLIVSVALTMACMGLFIALEVRKYHAVVEMLDDPSLAANAWDDQSVGVREAFRQMTSTATDEQRERAWNSYVPSQRVALFTQIIYGTVSKDPSESETAEVNGSSSVIENGTVIGEGNSGRRPATR